MKYNRSTSDKVIDIHQYGRVTQQFLGGLMRQKQNCCGGQASVQFDASVKHNTAFWEKNTRLTVKLVWGLWNPKPSIFCAVPGLLFFFCNWTARGNWVNHKFCFSTR